MKKYSEKEIDSWCNKFDHDLVIDIWESQMIFEDIPFATFLQKYQKLHKKKYGKKLE